MERTCAAVGAPHASQHVRSLVQRAAAAQREVEATFRAAVAAADVADAEVAAGFDLGAVVRERGRDLLELAAECNVPGGVAAVRRTLQRAENARENGLQAGATAKAQSAVQQAGRAAEATARLARDLAGVAAAHAEQRCCFSTAADVFTVRAAFS